MPPLREMVGRNRERADLRARIGAATRGAGTGLIVTGLPGIGKTRLVELARNEARRYKLAVAATTAGEQDRNTPMATLRSALLSYPPLRRAVLHLNDHSGGYAAHASRVGEVIGSVAVRRPLLIAIDDVHRADEGSATVLRMLITELNSLPIMWVFARRPAGPGSRSPGQEFIDWMLAQGTDEIVLGPLSDEESQYLARRILRAEPDDSLRGLISRSGGHPLLIEQLLSALQSDSRLRVAKRAAALVGNDLPERFVAMVELILGELPESANLLLRAGSIFERPFRLHEVAKLTGVPVSQLMEAAAEAEAAGILRAQGDSLAFCHDLVREVVYDGISPPTRATLHREAVEVLLAEGRPAVEAADHVMRSGTGGGIRAVEILQRAAGDLSNLAPRTAAGYLVRALEILDRSHHSWPELCAQAVRLLVSAGNLDTAREYGEAALTVPLNPAIRASLLLGLADGFKHLGHNLTAIEYADRALRMPATPLDIQAQLHGVRAHALLYVDDGAGAEEAGIEADRLGRATGEHSASVQGNTARCVVARNEGRLDDALAHAQRAVDTAARYGGAAAHRHPRLWLGSIWAALDNFPEANAAFIHAQDDAERLGTTWSQPLAHFHRAGLLAAQGRLEDAVTEAEAGLEVADAFHARQLSVPLHGLLATIAVIRDQIPVAHEELRQLERLRDEGISAAPELISWPTALVQQARGNHRRALDLIAHIYDRFPARLLMFSYDPGCGPAMVRIALSAGDRTRAQAAADATRRMAALNPAVASFAGAALHADGLFRDDLELLRQAVSTLRRSPRPLLLAAALEDTAETENRNELRPEAIEHLAEALELYIACGARAAAERLRRRRATIGITDVTDDDSGGRRSRLAALTPTELDVARLVAQSKTNRAIARQLQMSPHTVTNHLGNIFDKLGIRSRIELALIVQEEGGTGRGP